MAVSCKQSLGSFHRTVLVHTRIVRDLRQQLASRILLAPHILPSSSFLGVSNASITVNVSVPSEVLWIVPFFSDTSKWMEEYSARLLDATSDDPVFFVLRFGRIEILHSRRDFGVCAFW